MGALLRATHPRALRSLTGPSRQSAHAVGSDVREAGIAGLADASVAGSSVVASSAARAAASASSRRARSGPAAVAARRFSAPDTSPWSTSIGNGNTIVELLVWLVSGSL